MVAPSGQVMFSLGYRGRIGNSKKVYEIVAVPIRMNGALVKFKKAILVSKGS